MDPLPLKEGFALTALRVEDAAQYVELMKDSSISENLLALPYPYTLEDAHAWLNCVLGDPLRVRLQWAIRDAEDLLQGAIGVVGGWQPGDHRAEIGYWLGAEVRGRGLMTAAVRVLTDFLFAEFEVVRVVATPFASNAASHRVLEKAGFQREGLARLYHRKGTQLLDAQIYAKLRLPAPASCNETEND